MSGNRAELPGWKAPRTPDAATLQGRYARLERLNADAHAAQLFRAFDGADGVWDFLPYGPFASAAGYHRWVREVAAGDDPFFYAVFNRDSGAWEGVASFLRITPAMGVVEIGHINFAPGLQRSRAATEAVFLMMQWAFEAGYRRFEWKCDAANLPSRRAAQRLGLSFEGVFRQHLIVKARNRDTAWFAAIDSEWPALKEAFSVWLAPSNFGPDGEQAERLSDLTRLVRVASDPDLLG
jgi:RimJ/RimL family protein N-acetyltransferase